MFPTEIQIVEVGDWAAWAGRILADLGFRVIHLEPPTGSRSRQGLLGPDPVRRRWVGAREAFFERGKESVAINWHTPTGLGLAREIVYTADILLDGTSNGFLSLVAAGTEAPPGPPPRVVRITPYGDFGPYRELYGHDLLVYALSGQLYISGQPRQEPVRPPGEQSLVLAGLEAALAALALIWDESTASAEVSALEALAEMEHLLGYLSYQGSVVGRQGSQHRGAVPGTVYRARDGYLNIFISHTQPGAWDRFVEWMGRPEEWVNEPRYGMLPFRQERVAEIDAKVTAALADRSIYAVFEELQEQKLPAAPVLTPSQALADPQFRVRGVAQQDSDGLPALRPPYRRNGTWPAPGRVPEVGRDTEAWLNGLGISSHALRHLVEGGTVRLGALGESVPLREKPSRERPSSSAPALPLQGVRILDFSHMIAGPYVTLQLAWLGAEVIKVESRVRPDTFRIRDGNPNWEQSLPFASLNLGKRSITVNLKHPQGPEVIRRLVPHCDAVVENFSKGVLENLGLGYEALSRHRPDLIWLSLPGMGSDGPRSNYVTWGPNIMAFTGFTYLWNHPDQPHPVGSQVSYPDYLAGLFGATFLLAALCHRRATGEGSRLEVSQAEAAAYALGPAYQYALLTGQDLEPEGNGQPGHVPQGCYPCRGDDRWLAVVVPDDATWRRLAEVIAEPWALQPQWRTLLGRAQEAATLNHKLSEWTRNWERERLWHRLLAAGVPSAPVLDARDLMADPHLAARRFIVTVDHPVMGTLKMPGPPIRLTETPPRPTPPPLLGEANQYVFQELLGMTPEEVARLTAEGVIG